MTTALRLNEAEVKPIQRGRGVLKRGLFHGGVFAPPGYSEIVHIVSIAPRDLMILNNQYFTGNQQFQWLVSDAGTESPPPFSFDALDVSTSRSNANEWVMTYYRRTSDGYQFRSFHIPPTMRPIYIDPNNYIPTEITIARYGRRSNAAWGGAAIYFYKLPNETADPYFFHNHTINRLLYSINKNAPNPSVIPYLDGFGISGHLINSPFALPALANGGGAIQTAYFGGYGENNTTNNQNVCCVSHTFPFPIRANLFNAENTRFDPLVRIAITPIARVDRTNGLEHYPIVMVKVKCKAVS